MTLSISNHQNNTQHTESLVGERLEKSEELIGERGMAAKATGVAQPQSRRSIAKQVQVI